MWSKLSGGQHCSVSSSQVLHIKSIPEGTPVDFCGRKNKRTCSYIAPHWIAAGIWTVVCL